MKKPFMKFAAMFAVVAMLGACQTTNSGQKETIGTLLGAAGGALLGSKMGKGSGRLVGVAVGTLAGAYIGSSVGKSLDDVDRMKMQQTTQSALETGQSGQPSSWSNPDTGHSGRVTPTRTYFENDTPCREYTSTVTIDGRLETITGTACRNPDGTWSVLK